MVRAVKTTADKAPATPVPITDKQPKAKKAKAVAPETPVENVVVVPAPVEGESNVSARLSEYADKIGQLTTLAASLKAEFKSLEKAVAKDLKAAQKATQKKKRASGNLSQMSLLLSLERRREVFLLELLLARKLTLTFAPISFRMARMVARFTLMLSLPSSLSLVRVMSLPTSISRSI